jgi:hypothetical protein
LSAFGFKSALNDCNVHCWATLALEVAAVRLLLALQLPRRIVRHLAGLRP